VRRQNKGSGARGAATSGSIIGGPFLKGSPERSAKDSFGGDVGAHLAALQQARTKHELVTLPCAEIEVQVSMLSLSSLGTGAPSVLSLT
jgi:hypothetical protein